jgi:subtilase family serine protease
MNSRPDTNRPLNIHISFAPRNPAVLSAWNDGSGASGGGASTIFAKPTWQTSRTPADAKRDVPDIAFGASSLSPGFHLGDDNKGVAVIDCCWNGTGIAAPM